MDPSWQALHRAHAKGLWAVAYGMLGNVADADDAVQACFEKAWRARPELPSSERPARPYLLSIAMNLARDQLRKRKSQSYVGPWLPEPLPADGSLAQSAIWQDPPRSPQANLLSAEQINYAWLVALETLSENQRAVLVLRKVAGLSVKECAQALELGAGNIRVLQHRAEERLAKGEAAAAERREPTPEQLAYFGQLALALAEGDVRALQACLQQGVELIGDSGGEYYAARVPVVGAPKVALFLHKTYRQRTHAVLSPLVLNCSVASVLIDPQPGEGQSPKAITMFDFAPDGRIRRIYSLQARSKVTLAPPSLSFAKGE